jgi:PAS domain S-box-containing protein
MDPTIFSLLSIFHCTFLSLYFFEPVGSPAVRYASDLEKIFVYAILALSSVVFFAYVEGTTERKQAKTLLKESEARLADALAAGHVMAFAWDAVTRRSQRSENAIDILGAEQGDATNSPGYYFLRHVHSDDRMMLKMHVRNLSPGNPSYTLNFRYVCLDGREVWLEETGRGEFDAAGKLLRIRGLTRDITKL